MYLHYFGFALEKTLSLMLTQPSTFFRKIVNHNLSRKLRGNVTLKNFPLHFLAIGVKGKTSVRNHILELYDQISIEF